MADYTVVNKKDEIQGSLLLRHFHTGQTNGFTFDQSQFSADWEQNKTKIFNINKPSQQQTQYWSPAREIQMTQISGAVVT